ncbi:MAG: cytochrome c oxidase subunit II [Actinomycetota bacterium]|nr:cytochrome c oxidase subunit II [Actinomycetota bacterium]
MGLDPFPRTHRRTARRSPLGLLAAAVVVLGGCSQDSDSEFLRLALPQGSTDRTEAIFDLWIGAWIAAGIIGIGVFGLIVWTVLHYRRRSDSEIPAQTRYNLPIEVLYTVAPIIVIAVLFFFTVQAQVEVEANVDEPEHEISVVGQKWAWTFTYQAEEALGGDTDVYDIGTPAELTDLYLPVDETVRFTLESPDVIHSFWIPQFYFKRDVLPGRSSTFDVTPTQEGIFRGRCAELCGTYHARMLFDVHVVSRAEYDEHLSELQQAGQVGDPRGAADSTTVVGLDQESEQ